MRETDTIMVADFSSHKWEHLTLEAHPMTRARTDSYKPTYQRIADGLRESIRTGALDALPGEKELSERFQVSVGTIRHALKLLVDEGLIERRPRTGTNVRKTKKILRTSPQRLSGTAPKFIMADIHDQTLTVINFEGGVRTPTPEEDELIDCFGAHVRLAYRRRTHAVNDIPVQMATNYMPAHLFRDGGVSITQPDIGPGGIWEQLTNVKHPVLLADEYVDTRMPTPEEVEELHLRPGTPVFAISRTGKDGTGHVVDLAVIVLSGAAFRLRYRVLDKLAAP